jgi:hypothetical protein
VEGGQEGKEEAGEEGEEERVLACKDLLLVDSQGREVELVEEGGDRGEVGRQGGREAGREGGREGEKRQISFSMRG